MTTLDAEELLKKERNNDILMFVTIGVACLLVGSVLGAIITKSGIEYGSGGSDLNKTYFEQALVSTETILIQDNNELIYYSDAQILTSIVSNQRTINDKLDQQALYLGCVPDQNSLVNTQLDLGDGLKQDVTIFSLICPRQQIK